MTSSTTARVQIEKSLALRESKYQESAAYYQSGSEPYIKHVKGGGCKQGLGKPGLCKRAMMQLSSATPFVEIYGTKHYATAPS